MMQIDNLRNLQQPRSDVGFPVRPGLYNFPGIACYIGGCNHLRIAEQAKVHLIKRIKPVLCVYCRKVSPESGFRPI